MIGSITPAGRNLVSGNDEGGIYCTLAPPLVVVPYPTVRDLRSPTGDGGTPPPEGFCRIEGNDVGTDATRLFAIPNTYNHLFLQQGLNFLNPAGGLGVDNSNTFSTIGNNGGTSANSCTGFCNLVSGETTTAPGAVSFGDPGIVGNGHEGSIGIYNNYAGVNYTGTSAIPNGNGIDSSTSYEAVSTTVGTVATGPGGSRISLGNLASGNRNVGITVNPSATGSYAMVRGNLVGTDRTGLTALPNGGGGIDTWGSVGGIFLVGGAEADEGNVIAGNTGYGLSINGSGGSAATRNNRIGVNLAGDALGNGGDGVILKDQFNYIGDVGAGNIIANNGGNGVTVRRAFGNSANPRGNRIKYNSIYNNGGLGIDLSADTTTPVTGDGVTPNDCGDADSGPHGLQNFPILTAPVFNNDGTVTVGGAFGSLPSTTYTLDFYSNSQADPSDYGEGETYIGSAQMTTDVGGIASFLWTSTGTVSSGLKITATASDIDGNTSEFSCYAGRCSIFDATLDAQLEAARAVAGGGCQFGITVNLETDESDPNPGDGICDVDLGTVGPQCSLRAAIETANAVPGADFIRFDLTPSRRIIFPTTSLPPITERVSITGQDGLPPDRPAISLDGFVTSHVVTGLVFAAGSDGSSVRNLRVSGFLDGIVLESNNNTVEDCFIGTDIVGGPPERERAQWVGVTVRGNGNTVGGAGGGNLISGNKFDQVVIEGPNATGNKVKGNSIGFYDDGEFVADARSPNGIRLDDGASNNEIGGGTAEEQNDITAVLYAIDLANGSNGNTVRRNVILYSSYGIYIGSSSDNVIGGQIGENADESDANLFDRNLIGVAVSNDAAGSVRSANNKIFGNIFAVFDSKNAPTDTIGVSVVNADNTSIGSDQAGFGNFFGDQSVAGILIDKLAAGTIIQRNFIGLNALGAPRPNLDGIRLGGSGTQVVGNVISGNTEAGININKLENNDPEPTGNLIQNNRIGTNNSGTGAVPNDTGINIDGNANTVTGNLISSNRVVGVSILGNQNVVSQNKIGIEINSTSALGEQTAGISIGGAANILEGNTISGNLLFGVLIARFLDTVPAPDGNVIRGNLIGTNGAGTEAIPNGQDGIHVRAATNTLIGGFGPTPSGRNIISGNGGHGIILRDQASQTRISGNYIGTAADGVSPLGNTGNGIFLQSGVGATKIGGQEPNAGNTIAFNGKNGILAAADAGNNNIIDPNRIFGNTEMGIDIGEDGHTPNDPLDADTGPNNLQNYPEIVSKEIVSDELIIGFKVDSAPENSAYGLSGIYIEFFKADASGEGERFIGFAYYTLADYNGSLAGIKTVNLGNINTLGITPDDPITATATDASGNTSEFTPLLSPTASTVSVSGRIMTANGLPVRNALVTLTGTDGRIATVRSSSFGSYRFDQVGVGETYVLSVAAKRYVFQPRAFAVDDVLTDFDLVADP